MPSRHAKAPLEQHQYARNGKLPNAFMQAELADHINHAARFRLKEVARFSSGLVSGIPPGNSVTHTRWRFAFRPSPYMTTMHARAWMAPTESTTADAPHVRVVFNTDATATGEQAEIILSYGASPFDADTPSQLVSMSNIAQDSPGVDTDFSTGSPAYRDDVLYCDVQEWYGARCVGISIYEGELLTLTDPCAEGVSIGRPIFDKDRQDAVTATRALWKQGAAHLFNWSVSLDSNVLTRTSATSINVVDNTSTAISAATPGYTLDLRNKSTLRRGTVPCVFTAYGSIPSGSGTVLLKDSGGSTVATVTINDSFPQWFTTTVDLPATLSKYDVHYAGNGTQTVSVYAASLFQVEA